jgi:hypothetical protein
VRGIYLGNYVRWDPKAQHEQMMRTHGYRSAAFGRTFDCYDHVDCFNFMDIHDHIKFLKHGYSKVTDHASREIRHGRLTRVQALALVRQHEGAHLQHADLFCQWLGVDRHALDFMLDRHRNPRFWEEESPGRYVRRPEVFESAGAVPDLASQAAAFEATHRLHEPSDRRYITFGKGYPS